MLRLIVALLVASTFGAGAAQASPWAEAGDRQLRQDIELLKAAGIIRGPINSWPLPWAQIAATLDHVDAALPPHIAAAARRVQALSDRALRRSRYEVRAAVTNKPALIRDFGSTAREDVDVAVRAEHDFGRLSIGYGVGYRKGQVGDDIHFEPSYIAYALGNWALYGGFVETWWGPGRDGALLFSNSTRPFPKIGIKRLSPEPIDFPVLRWLGPWRFDIFAGLLNEKRSDFNNPAVVGMRFAFEPAHGLEIGLNRALQLCGKGRPCDIGTITDALIGVGDADNTGTPDEPGNQLAGFDISYTRMIGSVTAQAYLEAEAEDEDNFLIDQFGRQFGVALSGPVGDQGASWQVYGEYSDTLAIKLFGSTRYPGSFYNNSIYTAGFTYRDRPIGHSIDGDSEIWSVGVAYTDARSRRFYASLRAADLNRTETPRHRLTLNRETINIATLGVEWPTQFGDIRVEGRIQDDDVNTPGRSPTRGQFELAWRSRF